MLSATSFILPCSEEIAVLVKAQSREERRMVCISTVRTSHVLYGLYMICASSKAVGAFVIEINL